MVHIVLTKKCMHLNGTQLTVPITGKEIIPICSLRNGWAWSSFSEVWRRTMNYQYS